MSLLNPMNSQLRFIKNIKRGLYLEGPGDFVNRLIMGIAGVMIWLIGVINLLAKPP